LDEPVRSLLKQQLTLVREVAVSQVSWPVWRQACGEVRRCAIAIAVSHTRGGGRGADGNMIGMSIAAIRPKGNHHLGSEAAHDLADLADQVRVCIVSQCCHSRP
jgi:hypothetical protein